MRLTKYAHACVVLAKDGTSIVLDPGAFTPDAAVAVAGAAAVLITHEHFDHVDEAVLTAALAERPDLAVYGPAPVRDKFGDRVTAVSAGDHFEAGGFSVVVEGGTHASIHPDIPAVDNVGYLIDGAVFHPGDAYFVPDAPVDTLLLPTSGPWTRLADAADFVRAVRPKRVVQIHELMLSELGQNSTAAILGANGLTGVPVTILPPGGSVEI